MFYILKAKNDHHKEKDKQGREINEHVIISYANNRRKKKETRSLPKERYIYIFKSETIKFICTVNKYQLNFFKNSSAHIRARELTANFISLISLSISSRK
jgi:hypothetical protein